MVAVVLYNQDLMVEQVLQMEAVVMVVMEQDLQTEHLVLLMESV